jgi:hypothetical protein
MSVPYSLARRFFRRGAVLLDRLIMGALLGVASVALIQFLELGPLDIALTLSLYSFATAIPLLSMGLFIIAVHSAYQALGAERDDELLAPHLFVEIVETVGIVAAFTGIAAMFWHFSVLAGIVFVASSVLATTCALDYALRHLPRRIE